VQTILDVCERVKFQNVCRVLNEMGVALLAFTTNTQRISFAMSLEGTANKQEVVTSTGRKVNAIMTQEAHESSRRCVNEDTVDYTVDYLCALCGESCISKSVCSNRFMLAESGGGEDCEFAGICDACFEEEDMANGDVRDIEFACGHIMMVDSINRAND